MSPVAVSAASSAAVRRAKSRGLPGHVMRRDVASTGRSGKARMRMPAPSSSLKTALARDSVWKRVRTKLACEGSVSMLRAAKKALEICGPAAEKGWRETVELTKVVVPSVPKLVQGSVQGTGKREGASTSAKITRSEGADEVTAAARAAESTKETTTTEETVTTTTEVVTETKSMEMSAETMEETGTVWKKKNKSSE